MKPLKGGNLRGQKTHISKPVKRYRHIKQYDQSTKTASRLSAIENALKNSELNGFSPLPPQRSPRKHFLREIKPSKESLYAHARYLNDQKAKNAFPGVTDPWLQPIQTLKSQAKIAMTTLEQQQILNSTRVNFKSVSKLGKGMNASLKRSHSKDTGIKMKQAMLPAKYLSTTSKGSTEVLEEMEVIKHIILREQYLSQTKLVSKTLEGIFLRLKHRVEKYNYAKSQNLDKVRDITIQDILKGHKKELKNYQNELQYLLESLTSSTFKVVQSIQTWRKQMLFRARSIHHGNNHHPSLQPKPFIFQGKNYITKLSKDLDFIDSTNILSIWIGFQVKGNPLLIPPKQFDYQRCIQRMELHERETLEMDQRKKEMIESRKSALDRVLKHVLSEVKDVRKTFITEDEGATQQRGESAPQFFKSILKKRNNPSNMVPNDETSVAKAVLNKIEGGETKPNNINRTTPKVIPTSRSKTTTPNSVTRKLSSSSPSLLIALSKTNLALNASLIRTFIPSKYNKWKAVRDIIDSESTLLQDAKHSLEKERSRVLNAYDPFKHLLNHNNIKDVYSKASSGQLSVLNVTQLIQRQENGAKFDKTNGKCISKTTESLQQTQHGAKLKLTTKQLESQIKRLVKHRKRSIIIKQRQYNSKGGSKRRTGAIMLRVDRYRRGTIALRARHITTQRHRSVEAAIIIQRIWRGSIGRNLAQNQKQMQRIEKERAVAILHVQRMYRGHRGRLVANVERQVFAAYQKEIAALILIQSRCRIHLARKERMVRWNEKQKEERRRKKAEEKHRLALLEEARLNSPEERSAKCLQHHWRTYVSRKQNRAAIKIQSQIRMRLSKNIVMGMHHLNYLSATKIQSMWRGKQSRKSNELFIQNRREELIFQNFNNAAIRIQRFYQTIVSPLVSQRNRKNTELSWKSSIETKNSVSYSTLPLIRPDSPQKKTILDNIRYIKQKKHHSLSNNGSHHNDGHSKERRRSHYHRKGVLLESAEDVATNVNVEQLVLPVINSAYRNKIKTGDDDKILNKSILKMKEFHGDF